MEQDQTPYFITAISTPQNEDFSLHEPGLEAQIEDQARHGMDGLLVAGTMGAMQLLADETYRALARRAVEMAKGRFEFLVGAGDNSLARTLDRIKYLNTLKIDGIAVLAPHFVMFSQPELIDYYRALADAARPPLFLYDLPQVVKHKLEADTVVELSKHPNIRGVKCSDDPAYMRRLRDRTDPKFRVIVATPDMADIMLRAGFHEQLDGMWTLAPQWVAGLARCAKAHDWSGAAEFQKKIYSLKHAMIPFGFWGAFSAVMNARGIPGRHAPLPCRLLDPAKREAMLSHPQIAPVLEA